MMFRTHLAFGVFLALFFLPHIENKIVFVSVVLICSLLPDIDSIHSYLGRNFLFRPLQWATRHRGLLHSFTFCVPITILFALYLPVLALPFFLGYATHLLADALTIEGIRPFWPSRAALLGRLRTGGRLEDVFFTVIVVLDGVLFLRAVL